MKILLVEDDECMTSALLESLNAHHYSVNATQDGQAGLDLAKAFSYDVILLDVVLPGLDGLSLCRQLRAQGCQTPILMLSAKNQSCDRVVGLEAGADDYLVKPFEFSEVIARVQALLRRGRETAPTIFAWGDLCLNSQSQEMTYKGQPIYLTPKEYGLLELFLRNPHQLFTRSAILDHLWSLGKCPTEEAVNTHIKVLRQKLAAVGLTAQVIKTVHGLGYRLAPAPDSLPAAQNVQALKMQDPSPSKHASALSEAAQPQTEEAKVAASIAKVWDIFKTHWQDQLSLLHQASEQLATTHSLDEVLRKQAIVVAHRLVGALGTFGRPEGTDVARRIETLLNNKNELNPQTALQLSTLVESLRRIVEDPYPKSKSFDSLPPFSGSRGKVMVVDDDPQLLAVLPKILEPLGLQVTTLDNPQNLWEMMETALPNLLILDIEMPYFSGIDLCQMIRSNERWGEIPILFLTAHASLQFQNRAFIAGADDYVVKPVVPSELTARVLNRLERVRSRLRAKSQSWNVVNGRSPLTSQSVAS
jgi:DNA-binding response OmpR family regulator/HPt (histidine-containing phosphotransfer) domain-containing protein